MRRSCRRRESCCGAKRRKAKRGAAAAASAARACLHRTGRRAARRAACGGAHTDAAACNRAAWPRARLPRWTPQRKARAGAGRSARAQRCWSGSWTGSSGRREPLHARLRCLLAACLLTRASRARQRDAPTAAAPRDSAAAPLQQLCRLCKGADHRAPVCPLLRHLAAELPGHARGAAADEDEDAAESARWVASLDAPTRAVLLCGASLLVCACYSLPALTRLAPALPARSAAAGVCAAGGAPAGPAILPGTKPCAGAAPRLRGGAACTRARRGRAAFERCSGDAAAAGGGGLNHARHTFCSRRRCCRRTPHGQTYTRQRCAEGNTTQAIYPRRCNVQLAGLMAMGDAPLPPPPPRGALLATAARISRSSAFAASFAGPPKSRSRVQ
jgi:hypothetical protein